MWRPPASDEKLAKGDAVPSAILPAGRTCDSCAAPFLRQRDGHGAVFGTNFGCSSVEFQMAHVSHRVIAECFSALCGKFSAIQPASETRHSCLYSKIHPPAMAGSLSMAYLLSHCAILIDRHTSTPTRLPRTEPRIRAGSSCRVI